jgi:hypothetical protein
VPAVRLGRGPRAETVYLLDHSLTWTISCSETLEDGFLPRVDQPSDQSRKPPEAGDGPTLLVGVSLAGPFRIHAPYPLHLSQMRPPSPSLRSLDPFTSRQDGRSRIDWEHDRLASHSLPHAAVNNIYSFCELGKYTTPIHKQHRVIVPRQSNNNCASTAQLPIVIDNPLLPADSSTSLPPQLI